MLSRRKLLKAAGIGVGASYIPLVRAEEILPKRGRRIVVLNFERELTATAVACSMFGGGEQCPPNAHSPMCGDHG